MANQKRLWELGILTLITFWFFFISTNVDPRLGTIYMGLPILTIAIIFADIFFGQKQIKFINRNVTWGQAFIWGVGGYLIVIASTFFTGYLAAIIPLKEILLLLSATAPVFSESVLINFLNFGLVISFTESYALFIALPDLLASIFKVNIDKRNLFNPKLLGIIISISILFLLLHITTKGITNESILILVFIMAMVSVVITIYTKDARPALILHLIANIIAISGIFNIVNLISLPLFLKFFLH